jgi:hypothetical protein
MAREAQETQRRERAAAVEKARLEREQREKALDALANEFSVEGAPVTKVGDQLVLTEESPLAEIDPEQFKRSSLQSLFAREARRRWSPVENWVVIASITAGVLLLVPFFLVGLLLLGAGFCCRHWFNQRYKSELIRDFPKLFQSLTEEPSRELSHS